MAGNIRWILNRAFRPTPRRPGARSHLNKKASFQTVLSSIFSDGKRCVRAKFNNTNGADVWHGGGPHISINLHNQCNLCCVTGHIVVTGRGRHQRWWEWWHDQMRGKIHGISSMILSTYKFVYIKVTFSIIKLFYISILVFYVKIKHNCTIQRNVKH